MVVQKEDADLKRAAMLKDARARARTFFSILGDAFLNEYLPHIEARYNEALSRQEPFELEADDVDIALAAFVRRRRAIEAGK